MVCRCRVTALVGVLAIEYPSPECKLSTPPEGVHLTGQVETHRTRHTCGRLYGNDLIVLYLIDIGASQRESHLIVS